ncbi:IDEAL domain-containing protein [Paenibacillus farraposensis]|uniref:IDEAL domain-containing protein n=2 Tax=Paenibacillus farraposensis TaxID=2807095 RepID=A0ABW4DF89_9BACL|nr:IDEAL domain-containing protein [Paenibacillus farraposensis]MCC3379238.1 IDEAL domain-containing protein [Paenibacillus farraposensis]
MITLNTVEIIEIIKKQIPKVMNIKPVELRFTDDFGRASLTGVGRKFTLTNQHYSAKVMDCVLETQVRPILMCEIIYFLKCEFIDGHVEVQLDYDVCEEDGQGPTASAVITFDHATQLGVEELADLIDLALHMNDKTWFEELSSQYVKTKAGASIR